MIDSKMVRSPAGQKLIHDLMLGEDDLDARAGLDDADDTGAGTPSMQRSQLRSSGPLRPSNGSPRRSSLPAAGGRSVASAKAAAGTDPDTPWPADRPATAPASSYMLLLPPPQLPAARGQNEKPPSAPAAMSPLLERHMVSRHTNAYLGVVTAVLHQVASPATTGAPRGTQRRPGTVPRDVYRHSAIAPPKRHHLSNVASSMDDSSTGGPSARTTADEHTMALVPTTTLRGGAGGGMAGPYASLEFLDGVDAAGTIGSSVGYGSGYSPSANLGGLPSRGGSGEYYVPYLDRSYGSHAPLACAVDAVARRAEAHKALTRQRLLQKHLEAQLAAQLAAGGGGRRDRQQSPQAGSPSSPKLTAQQQQQAQQGPVGQVALFQPSSADPYQLRLEGGVQPVALGLAWDTSPGVVAAAAAAAATAAAAIAARAEGLSAAASPLLPRDAPVSPSLKDMPYSMGSRAGARTSAAGGSSPPNTALRRRVGGMLPEWSPAAATAASGRVSPSGAPSSPRRVRLQRAPQTAAEAAAMAAEVEAAARAHLPPAVRRGYSGQLAAQTVKDWETIAEPNRRMMQEIDNVTSLVRGNTSRKSSAHYSAGGGGGRAASRNGRQLSTSVSSSSIKRRGPDGVAAAAGGGGGGGGGGGEPVEGEGGAGGAGGTTQFGKHTSARARRRYIRYSLDVFPELGLPARGSSGRAGGATDGPFGAAAAAAAAAAGGSWAGWAGGAGAAAAGSMAGDLGPDSEPSVGQMDEYTLTEDYGDSDAYGAQYGANKGPRYMLAAAARVPVPVHLHPLPTPTAAVAAVVASGSVAGAAAASLPQWVDPRVAASSGPVIVGAANDRDQQQQLQLQSSAGLQPSLSAGSAVALPGTASSSHSSLHGSRGSSRGMPSTLAGLAARGIGIQGVPSGPPLGSPSPSLVLDEQQSAGSWSAAGGTAGGSRSPSLSRHQAQYHSSQRIGPASGGAGSLYDEASMYREGSHVSGGGGDGAGLRDGVASPTGADSPIHMYGSRGGIGTDSPSLTALPASRISSPPVPGSPAREPSLLPMPYSGTGGGGEGVGDGIRSPILFPGAGSTAAAGAAAAAAAAAAVAAGGRRLENRESFRAAGSGNKAQRGQDLDPSASRGSTPVPPPFTSSPDSRLSTPGSYLQTAPEDEDEAEEYGGEEDGAAAAAGEEEEAAAYGDEYEEGGSVSAAASAARRGPGYRAGERQVVIAPEAREEEDEEEDQVPAGGELEGWSLGKPSPTASGTGMLSGGYGEWDVGSTPRLPSRQPAGGWGSPLPATAAAVEGRRPSSATGSGAVLSTAPGTRSGGRTPAGAATSTAPSVSGEASAASAWAAQGQVRTHSRASSVRRGDAGSPEAAAAAAAAGAAVSDTEGAGGAASGEDGGRDTTPTRLAASTPQGPVLTHGTGYRVVTSVAAALVSEDPREVARMAAQRDVEAQLERSSEHTAKLKAANRASKALLRAGTQHTLPPSSLPPLAAPASAGGPTGYSIVQPRASRIGLHPAEEAHAGGLAVLAAPVPAPAEMEALSSAARALLAAPPAAVSRQAPHLHQTPGSTGGPQAGALLRRLPTQSQTGDKAAASPLGPGSYMHVQTAIEPGRTVQMQDVWAT